MTKKKLNTQAVVNELRGQSAFFQSPPQPTPLSKKSSNKKERGKEQDISEKLINKVPPSSRDTTQPRDRDTTVSRYHDTIIELIRKAVKDFGKEAATHRFTIEEKKAIADLIYVYKGQGIRTSENEIARIAVNFIINDYKENGENSVLDQALRALNG